MADSALLEATLGRSIKESLYHELMGQWFWTISSHFDIRLTGNVIIPSEGSKDVAELVFCRVGVRCQGEDPALAAELRFRALF
jgi:hypothetical protein